jgi:hypothetical protein
MSYDHSLYLPNLFRVVQSLFQLNVMISADIYKGMSQQSISSLLASEWRQWISPTSRNDIAMKELSLSISSLPIDIIRMIVDYGGGTRDIVGLFNGYDGHTLYRQALLLVPSLNQSAVWTWQMVTCPAQEAKEPMVVMSSHNSLMVGQVGSILISKLNMITGEWQTHVMQFPSHVIVHLDISSQVICVPLPYQNSTLDKLKNGYRSALAEDALYILGGHHNPNEASEYVLQSLDNGESWQLVPTANDEAVTTSNWNGTTTPRQKTISTTRRAICVMGYEIICCGGSSRAEERSVNDCDRFDTITMKWSSMPPLNRARNRARSFVYRNTVYVLGNNDNCLPDPLSHHSI